MREVSSRHSSLVAIIFNDFLSHYKVAMLLMVAIVITALSVVLLTSHTRVLIEQREQMILTQDKLNDEWRNLILEEEVWGKQNRVLQIATDRLGMKYVELEQEYVVIEKQEQ